MCVIYVPTCIDALHAAAVEIILIDLQAFVEEFHAILYEVCMVRQGSPLGVRAMNTMYLWCVGCRAGTPNLSVRVCQLLTP